MAMPAPSDFKRLLTFHSLHLSSRDKPVAVGDAPGVFWPELTDAYGDGVWKNAEETKEIIQHTSDAYAALVQDCAKVADLEFAYAGCS